MSTLLLHLALVNSSGAATLTVGPSGMYPGIGGAILDAQPGDRIEVEPGSYSERALQVDIELEIVGTGGSGSTTWEGPVDEDVVEILDGADVRIEGFTLDARGTGRSVDVFAATAELVDIVSDGNAAQFREGGVVQARPGAIVTISDSSFTNNSADNDGGAVFAEGAELTVTDTVFESNSAQDGGGLFALDTVLTIERCTFADNEAEEDGGGLWASGSLATLTDVDVLGNTNGVGQWSDTGDGAGAYFTGDADVRWTGGLIEGNGAANTGGGLQFQDGAFGTLEGLVILSNGGTFGGGLYAATEGALSIVDSEFTSNEANAESGGAIRWRSENGSELTITGSLFEANMAATFGGALGVISLGETPAGTLVLDDTTFESNLANVGGAMSLADVASITATHLTLCTNEAGVNGGGVHLLASGSVENVWTNNVFTENLATGSGGGLFVRECPSGDFVNNSFLGNAASDGGGAKLELVPAQFVNNLVAYSPSGDGLRGEGPAGTIEVAYSLFFDNVGEDLPTDLQGGTGLLFADPMLVGFTADQDCGNDQPWPDAGSPLIDAGDPALTDPDGSTSDIGAFGGPDADTDVFTDDDGDGWTAGADCDDADPTINPDADEICDGVDNDCDGTVDVGASDSSTFYSDSDGDGFGVDSDTTEACDAPEGYAATPGDCDDTLATVFPDAPEVCDGIDNDCDAEIDESQDGWWPDADGDGYGDDTAEPVGTCEAGDGQVDNGLDCDDSDPDINPAADDEPGDGIDSNCDGEDGIAEPDVNADEDLSIGAGCGCVTGSSPGPWVVLLPLALVARRRR